VTYYPKWVDTANLRFAYRLIREPRRLWRRYLLEYPSFWYGLIPAFLGAN
jgi:N-acetylglucosaminyldiphosphoundecaprenol N-acetyl-beta-D-mannosaminyltransferase